MWLHHQRMVHISSFIIFPSSLFILCFPLSLSLPLSLLLLQDPLLSQLSHKSPNLHSNGPTSAGVPLVEVSRVSPSRLRTGHKESQKLPAVSHSRTILAFHSCKKLKNFYGSTRARSCEYSRVQRPLSWKPATEGFGWRARVCHERRTASNPPRSTWCGKGNSGIIHTPERV